METIHLKVKSIIGGDDPVTDLETQCLGINWKVPKECLVVAAGIECSAPIAKLYVLEEEIQGHKVVGVCNEHHKELVEEGVVNANL